MNKNQRQPVTFKNMDMRFCDSARFADTFSTPAQRKEIEQQKIQERAEHLYTPSQAKKAIEDGEILILNGEDSAQKVYLRIDKSFPLSAFQFYNQNGDLVFTFPWNGQFKEDYPGLAKFPSAFPVAYDNSMKEITISVTDKGRIAIDATCKLSVIPFGPTEESSVMLFDETGKEAVTWGSISKKGYPNKNVFDDNGPYGVKDPITLFTTDEGDKVFDYCFKNTENRYMF